MFTAIVIMLSSVSGAVRRADDRIAYEECYQVAMAGLATTKAWIMRPGQAQAQLGYSASQKFEALTSGALALSDFVRNNRNNEAALRGLSNDSIVQTYFMPFDSSFGGGATLADGRRVLLELPNTQAASGVVYFMNDTNSTPTGSIFSLGQGGTRSMVRRVRVTTPCRSTAATNGDDLRRVSLIIESEAVTNPVGVAKRRVVQQRLLLVPNEAQPGKRITGVVAGGAIDPAGQSSLNVHWAPVLAKGNIHLLDCGPLQNDTTNHQLALSVGHKFYGAGTDPDDTPNVGMEKWLRWQSAETLYSGNGGNTVPVFGNISGVQVTDFYSQLMAGQFGGYSADSIQLQGLYAEARTTVRNASSVLYDTNAGGSFEMGSGALVQHWSQVAQTVDSIIRNEFDYNTWKLYAQSDGFYLRKSSNKYVDASGSSVRLSDLSMWHLVDGTNTSAVPDRCLFIDAPGDTVQIPSGFFWKGLIYINGNVDYPGTNARFVVRMKNPDEYAQDPTGLTTGRDISGAFLDGALFASGNVSRSGSGAIYGTMVIGGTYTGGGNPCIYYNSRLKNGGLFQTPGGTNLAWMASGPICELGGW